MSRIIPFSDLQSSDLFVDAIYEGGTNKNQSDDVISKLLRTEISGGFRILGRKKSHEYKLCALYTDLINVDWPDTLEVESGRFIYFGDNKKPGHELHETPKGGNRLLRFVFDELHNGKRTKIPPFFVFTKGNKGRDVIFHGLAVPGHPETNYSGDLVVVWNKKGFNNYRAVFTLLDVRFISNRWVDDLLDGQPFTENAPDVWVDWVKTGRYTSLIDKKLIEYAEIRENTNEDYKPMEQIIDVDKQLSSIKQYISKKGFHYPGHIIENFYLSLKTKPFVILAGISGTGKTKLAKLFAEALGAKMELIPVRPDWSDPTDLIGYRDLSGKFREGRLTQVLVEAAEPENKNQIYFICLDEMNLARVEHYFSDILSMMETERWENGRIVTDFILSLEDRLNGVYIPDNVYLIGTVNMDETTHPFSKKVLDRAQVIEFNYINLDSYPEMISMVMESPQRMANSFLKREYLTLQDAYSSFPGLIKRTTEGLIEINQILEKIHAHVGFRVRDSVCFYMVYNERFKLMTEEQAFDLQWLQKILPRIQGSSSSIKRALIELMQVATGQQRNVEEMMNDPAELFNVKQDAPYPQSAQKTAYMLRRLEEDGFTSFWLS